MKRIGKTIVLLSILSSVFLMVYTSCQKELSCENCTEVNKPPIANAGHDTIIFLPVDSVILDGSKSADQDDGIAGYQWTKISGTSGVILKTPLAVKTVANKLVKSVYLFELTVTDKAGHAAKDTVEVVVNSGTPVNHPPVANAGNDTTITEPANSVSLSGLGSSDPDNNISSYFWTQITGPSPSSIVNSNAMQTKAENLKPGDYYFELKVTDSLGLFSKDTVHVTVNAGLPVISGGHKMKMIITLPIDSVWIDDWDRADESYNWIKIAGPVSGTVKYSYGPRTLVNNVVPGSYTFLKIPYSFQGPADTVEVVVIDDPNDRNSITYIGLHWENSMVVSGGITSLNLWKPTWADYSNPALEVYLQMSFVNSGQWFKLPSSQGGIDYRVDCSPFPNCLSEFVIRPTPQDLTLLNNKPCNLKLKIL